MRAPRARELDVTYCLSACEQTRLISSKASWISPKHTLDLFVVLVLSQSCNVSFWPRGLDHTSSGQNLVITVLPFVNIQSEVQFCVHSLCIWLNVFFGAPACVSIHSVTVLCLWALNLCLSTVIQAFRILFGFSGNEDSSIVGFSHLSHILCCCDEYPRCIQYKLLLLNKIIHHVLAVN